MSKKLTEYYAKLERWMELKAMVDKLSAEERALREDIAAEAFPEPKEGVNNLELPDGRVLKVNHKVYRNVDEKGLAQSSLDPEVKEKLFRVKHSLRLTPYRELDHETRRKVDRVITERPGLATIDIKEPKV